MYSNSFSRHKFLFNDLKFYNESSVERYFLTTFSRFDKRLINTSAGTDSGFLESGFICIKV